MTSRLNNPNASLTYGNVNTHIFTEFSTMNKESTQKEVLQAIKDINISAEIGDITVESSDSVTHSKLDTLNTTVSNKHLNSTTDSVNIGNFPATQPISGSVSVSNLPATQAVTGSVSITNSSIPVTGTFFQETQPISGSVSVSNLPATQAVSGSVSVSNLPATQAVTGSVSITNTSIPVTGTFFQETQPISGSVSVSNFPTDTAKEAKQDTQIEELQKIVNKTGDITAQIPYEQGASIWADSTPTPIENFNSPNGWIYQNAEAGNAMNLFYFNGNNETKTLSQVVGQYAVVSNLASVLNNKMILVVYTKGSPFFTTRITHSPPSSVNMVAGGKYLLYWGAVPDDIFPELPRLNFTDITTTGPAVGTEEILSVSLNSDSGASVGSVVILIESLGVVFSNGSVNQSRVYNLITDNNEYQSLINIQETVQTLNQKITINDNGINSFIVNTTAIPVSLSGGIDVNNFPATQNAFITNDASTAVPVSLSAGVDVNNTVDVLITNVEPISITGTVDVNNITNYALEADGNLEEIRNKTDNFNFNDNSGVLELNVFDIQNNAKLDAIETYTSKLNDLTFDGSSNLNVNIASGSLTVDSVKIQASNGDNLTATGSSLNTNITNTSIDVHNKVFHNGSWVNLKGSSNGNLSVNSSTQDGNGTDITSTDLLNSKRGLDTASSLFGYSGSVRTALTCDIGGKLLISSYTADDLGNGITSSATSTSKNSLDTASSLYVSNGTARTALTATGSSLDANITNTVPVSGTFFQATQPVSIASTVPVSGTFFQTVQPISLRDGIDNLLTSTDTTASQRSLDTASALYTTDATTRSALTSTAINSIRALDINVCNSGAIPVSGTVAFSNSTIGISGTVATDDSTGNGYLNTINQGVGYSYIEATALSNVSIAGAGTATYYNWTRGQYKDRAVFYYQDGASANTDSISLFTKETPSGNAVLLGTFYPYIIGATRNYSGNINLLPFNTISVRNNSASTITGVSLKIFSA
jgi:hypothetical protein